jgi:hypothetical protein
MYLKIRIRRYHNKQPEYTGNLTVELYQGTVLAAFQSV